jgi:hypothetical protein
MLAKWVDISSYLGPDRRRADRHALRWNERRRSNQAGGLPSLGSLLRRLSVQLTNLDAGDNRAHALQLAQAAIAKAEAENAFDCANAVRDAARYIAVMHARDRDTAAHAEAAILRAMALVVQPH